MSRNEDIIRKGFYSLFSNSESNTLNKHSKKGSEIKDKLGTIIPSLNDKKKECLDKMNAELSHTGFAPDIKCDHRREYHHLLDFIPNKFSYDLIYDGEKYVDTSNGIEEQSVKVATKEEASAMREYNKYAMNYMDLCVNKLKLESLKRNIQDNKTYNLSTDQLSLLGF